ncbi:autophagy-related protein 23-like isoform X2 [Aricia agestis]|uniref:autophagy-related protein 23-like isoform X2 n=1 Tax=Aricia agestis TaxID=91739 RepID=UPI001C206AE5|nr:autophagy-related protein 23-like isoform X2 [Aricia agestis]
MTESNIMSIREMINTAFGEQEVNKVNFKLIQTILYILARQLRLLERQVGVNIELGSAKPSSSISITEVKLQAKVSKPKKRKGSKSAKTDEADKNIMVDENVEAEITKDKPIGTAAERKSTKKTEIKRAQKSNEASMKRRDEITKEERRKERANSREQAENSPTPMASLDSFEYTQYEKLLVVDRVSKEEAIKKTAETQRLQIVTQEQFDQLNNKVKALEKQLSENSAALPENMQLMKESERAVSTDDKIPAFSLLSSRLNAAETTITKLMNIVTDFASKKDSLENYDSNTIKSQSGRLESRSKQDTTSGTQKRWTTHSDIDEALEVIEEDIMNQVKNITDKTVSNAENALRVARNLENELDSALNLGSRMEELENLVSVYAEQINTLDTNLSSQMSNYQEQLTQMQHDLECGIESMLETAANSASDPIAVAELNTNFTNLQNEIDFTHTNQKKLEENQELLSFELKGLYKQLELLRGIKTDRDEVIDALRDKVGLETLNGLVNEKQFEAVRLDLEKRIKAAYNKFDSQELQWQRAIDDLQCKLDDKADIKVLEALRSDIDNNLNTLKKRLDEIKEIVGEPSAAAVSKVLLRDTACISCLTPANMDPTEPNLLPSLPACKTPKNVGDNTPKEEDKLCYSGKPIPHKIDPSVRVCHRYCGGSHTVTSNARSKLTATVGVRRAKIGFQEVGQDGKMYIKQDPDVEKAPCVPCNVALMQSHDLNLAEPADEESLSEMSHDFFKQYQMYDAARQDNGSLTPPYFVED